MAWLQFAQSDEIGLLQHLKFPINDILIISLYCLSCGLLNETLLQTKGEWSILFYLTTAASVFAKYESSVTELANEH